MNCLTCKTNILKNENNFLQLKLTLYGDCVSICPNDTYEFSLNNACLLSCPNYYEINRGKKNVLKK